MICPNCREDTNPTLVYCTHCGGSLEMDLEQLVKLEEIRARELRAHEATKEAKHLMVLALFLLVSVLALRKVVLYDLRPDVFPGYRVPLKLVQELGPDPKEGLPVEPLPLPIPEDR